MAITGAHILLYTPEAEALRATLRDAIGWPFVDDGDGWLIFALPPAELGIHPSDSSTRHEVSFMCDDIEATVAELKARGIAFATEPSDAGFGIEATMVLAGGVEVSLYEPRHQTAIDSG